MCIRDSHYQHAWLFAVIGSLRRAAGTGQSVQGIRRRASGTGQGAARPDRCATCGGGTGRKIGCRKIGCWIIGYRIPEVGWGGRIRTYDTRYQKPMPYHLATPQSQSGGNVATKICPIKLEDRLKDKYVSRDAPPDFSRRILSERLVICMVCQLSRNGC